LSLLQDGLLSFQHCPVHILLPLKLALHSSLVLHRFVLLLLYLLPVRSKFFHILRRHLGTPFNVLLIPAVRAFFQVLASKLFLIGPRFHEVIGALSKPATVLFVFVSKASEAFLPVPVKLQANPEQVDFTSRIDILLHPLI
jgi:hypothetical protein